MFIYIYIKQLTSNTLNIKRIKVNYIIIFFNYYEPYNYIQYQAKQARIITIHFLRFKDSDSRKANLIAGPVFRKK